MEAVIPLGIHQVQMLTTAECLNAVRCEHMSYSYVGSFRSRVQNRRIGQLPIKLFENIFYSNKWQHD